MTETWYPRFEIATFSESPEIRTLLAGIPEVRVALCDEGVPRAFFGYRVDDSLTVIAGAEGEAPFIRFGTGSLSDAICVALHDGQVVESVDVPGGQVNVVNSTVHLFTETVKALIGRFPYYDKGASSVEIRSVSREVRDIIRSVDPVAALPGNYWSAFADNMLLGDFGTEDLLS